MKNTKKGFTLIELLVVIAIIGLLATLSVVALNNARERARDTRRVSDIKQIQTALELFFNANNEYPTAGTALNQFQASSGQKLATAASGGVILLDPIPTPPTPNDCTNNTYTYTRPTATSYCIRWCLGNDTGGLVANDSIWATQNSIYAGTGESCP